MTIKELSQKFEINIHIFEEHEFEDEDEAFYISELRTMFVSSKIAEQDRVKVILHELGHEGHLPHLYQIFREKHELQANRNMIHHLLKAELDEYGSECFNYITFMEKYKLKTIADETMVKEEFYNLAEII
ncbi:ImmA/IrrE family metallo-endopeptidase [Streptococcus hillyeri]|uniref:ImmA/IrrE family metallo-endopeptidase n=1 Tax=Streptococcus hillyeri TaxID=2282420 RepID=UPI0034E1C68E